MSILTRLTRVFAQRFVSPSRYVLDMSSSENESHKPCVYLTFDDGPHPDRTPRVLDALERHEAKATFFILGERAGKEKALLRRLAQEGHTVGTHSWSHWSALTTRNNIWLKDIQRARTEIEQIVGQSCPLFRPPYGTLTPLTLLALLRSDYQIVQWSVDTKDFEAKEARDIINWYQKTPPNHGDIVLMHDNKNLTSCNLFEALTHWSDQVNFKAMPVNRPSCS